MPRRASASVAATYDSAIVYPASRVYLLEVAAKRSQPSSVSLEGFSRYSRYIDCLKLVWRELGKLGIDEYGLPTYQQRLFSDLQRGLDYQALEHVYDYWNYDLPKLLALGRGWRKDVPAKPRIDIEIELSSQGNLKLEWFPRGIGRWGWEDRKDCDFLRWHRDEHRSGGWDSRPSNEILFIHGIDEALVRAVDGHRYMGPTQQLDHVLLHACGRLVEKITERLDSHFDVRMRQAIFIEYEKTGDALDWRGPPDRISSWAIEDPEDHKRREELAELDDMGTRLGFSEKRFLEQWEIASRPKATGPTPSPEGVSAKVAKALRQEGVNVTKTQTDRARYLVDRHRPAKFEGLRVVK